MVQFLDYLTVSCIRYQNVHFEKCTESNSKTNWPKTQLF